MSTEETFMAAAEQATRDFREAAMNGDKTPVPLVILAAFDGLCREHERLRAEVSRLSKLLAEAAMDREPEQSCDVSDGGGGR